MYCSITGTIRVVVIFSSRISSHDCSGSNAFRIVTEEPPYMQQSTGLRAPTWNIGNEIRYLSPAWKSAVATAVRIDQSTVSCECITPFGNPVVPLVYMMKTRSSPAPTGAGSSAEAELIHSS